MQNILFDLDGTLVDSSRAHELAFLEVLEVWAVHRVAEFSYESVKGMGTRDALAGLVDAEPETLCEMARDKQRAYLRLLERGEVGLFPFAVELLDGIARAGKRSFLVTSAGEQSVSRVFERFDLARHFVDVVTSAMVERPKPAPDVFRLVLDRNGLEAGRCLTVEDSPNGVRASRAAGVEAVVVHGADGAAGIRHYADLGVLLRALVAAENEGDDAA
ncbi:MAG: HAD family phosphatase [Myxococcota bacterium]